MSQVEKAVMLSSSDGISYSLLAQRIESSESQDARRRAAGNGLTSYQELEQEKKAKEQQEYANTIKFAPKKALEEDDFVFIAAESKKEKALTDAVEREAVLAFEQPKSQYVPLTKTAPRLRLKKQQEN